MSQLLSPDTFEFFARYLLAGYVFLTLRSWQIAAERPRLNEIIAEAIILSLINQVILLATFAWADQDWHDRNASASLFLQYVGQPMILGVCVGALAARDSLPPGFRRLLMPGARPVTEAYEFAFQANSQPGFVIVGFEDGSEVFGYYGEASMASEERKDGGIYLERLYTVNENGDWSEAVPPRSAWISISSARSIEFLSEETE